MSTPSNLYAEKIFSEHPTVLWALDDSADYISLITEQQRSIHLWDISGGESSNLLTPSGQPFVDSNTTKIIGDIPESTVGQVKCVSEDILNFNDLNKTLATFSTGCYLYSESAYITGVEIGYEYDDTYSGNTVEVTRLYETEIFGNWIFVSQTFDIPSQNTTLRLVLKINYISGGTEEDYSFITNGFTFGQWSEEFNSTSLGVEKIEIPLSINLGSQQLYGIEASAYGLADNNGYYFVKDNALVAKNTGIPLVYGSSNLTTLSNNDSLPSLIVPGFGFLNEAGKYKEYTAEMWLRINSDSTTLKRIFGPISSTDGIYVNGPFIQLKIGNNFASHFVGEWTRPMLIHIRVIKNNASLLINGDQVISLNYLTSDLSFPELFSEEKENDWLGFWSYEDVSPIDVDCVAIYSYQVPISVAKRRFVYGQGVEFPENINTAYSGSSIFIDYPFADYSNSYSYPDLGKWNQGIRDNLIIKNSNLSAPEYKLPSIVLDGRTESEFYFDSGLEQNENTLFITFTKNNIVKDGYFVFDSLEQINDPVKSFYSVIKLTKNVSDTEYLFLIKSENALEEFSITVEPTESNESVISYNFKNSLGNISRLVETEPLLIGEQFLVGLNIDKFVRFFASELDSIFGNRSAVKCYVGGRKELSNTFHGKIYNVGFSNERNFEKISHMFTQDTGIPLNFNQGFEFSEGLTTVDGGGVDVSPLSTELSSVDIDDVSIDIALNHLASYTLLPKEYFGSYTLDIGLQGYWEDNIPLTYFAQYITDARGDNYYDLDFLQFNINYPAPSKFTQESQEGEWSYEELLSEYASPIQRSYTALDNHLFTGFDNYLDLKNRSTKTFKYDTETSLVRSYITFQYTESGANAVENYFTNQEKPEKYGTVTPGSNWMTTKYEVVNNMIVYPPKQSNITDLSLVLHLEFKINGLKMGNVFLRNLQLCSQAFNDSSPNPIGTRFGSNIYPYRKSGVYYDYKTNNPFSIYKGSTPYLYLTRYSGIELRGQYDPAVDRGLVVPINSSTATNYKLVAMQSAIRYDSDFFPYSPTKIFEIEAKDRHIQFYMVANHPDGKRAKIYAINAKTGTLENDIAFYWNGKIVKEPSITVKEWGFLGIGFPELLDFSSVVGSLKINGPIMFNTISYYQSTHLQEIQQTSTRPWFRVKQVQVGADPIEWYFWKNSSTLWKGVLVLSTKSYYGVDSSDIYKSYTGTDKIIIDSDSMLTFNKYEYTSYGDVSWQQKTLDAV